MNYPILLFCLVLSLSYESMSSQDITMVIEGLNSGKGGVNLTLFAKSQEKSFPVKPDNSQWQKYQELTGKTQLELIIPNLPDGEYAAFAYHDENGDKQLNTNFLGIPKEGYGATNGAKNKFGPPKFSDASFKLEPQVSDKKRIPIKIVY